MAKSSDLPDIIVAPTYAAGVQYRTLRRMPARIPVITLPAHIRGRCGQLIDVVNAGGLSPEMRAQVLALEPCNFVEYVAGTGAVVEPDLPLPPHFETVEQADAWAAEVRASSEWTKG